MDRFLAHTWGKKQPPTHPPTEGGDLELRQMSAVFTGQSVFITKIVLAVHI